MNQGDKKFLKELLVDVQKIMKTKYTYHVNQYKTNKIIAKNIRKNGKKLIELAEKYPKDNEIIAILYPFLITMENFTEEQLSENEAKVEKDKNEIFEYNKKMEAIIKSLKERL